MKSVDPRSRSYQIAVGLVLLLIVYGSLYPFRWDFSAPKPFVWLGRVGLVDLIENVILFLPLGFLLGWNGQARSHRGSHALQWTLMSLAVAGALQVLQIYLPRTPAFLDVVFNMAGFGIGWSVGFVARWRAGQMLEQHRSWAQADRFALIMVALWLISELYPLIPTLDISSVARNVKSLWLVEPWQPRRMLVHAGTTVIGLTAVVQLARTGGFVSHARPVAFMAAALVLAGKFLVVDQHPGVAAVAGIVMGSLAWRWIDGWADDPRWMATAALAAATFLLAAVWPWQWRDPPAPMSWLPFSSSLSTWVHATVPARAFECFCFGAIVWSTVRNGALVIGMTICTAVMALACEWLQRYLPTRTAEITPVFLALAMGWLVSVCSPSRVGRTGSRKSNP